MKLWNTLTFLSTISLGKYGAFPSNLIIDRPFHLTYEVQEKRQGETFSRLRVVPATELNADALAETSDDTPAEEIESEDVIAPADGEELTLVEESSGKVLVRSNREIIDDSARQTLTTQEIEELKKKGAAAGQELITKLLLSHTAIDQKTAYSLAKYKLLKTKKYIRRFTVLPLDVVQLAHWMLEDKDASKIMEMRQEAMAMVGCWADVHFSAPPVEGVEGPHSGRWLVIDDTGGLLTASLAERMGILHPESEEDRNVPKELAQTGHDTDIKMVDHQEEAGDKTQTDEQAALTHINHKKRQRRDDFSLPYAKNNTITIVHHNTQPNLFLLRYFDYDNNDSDPKEPYHPLFTNLHSLSWLQLLSPEDDSTYTDKPEDVTPEILSTWKTNRRGNYHRKRRRWARTRHVVNTARAGNFSGLAVASTMDPISILRHALPLLAGGAPIAIYSQSIEPLSQLADVFSVGRRAAWVTDPPAEAEGKSAAELERWEGSAEFPINPTLLLGASIQTSRARRWQVLPNRTHPLMTERGGAEGYIFTGWRAVPVEGKIEARGKFKKTRR